MNKIQPVDYNVFQGTKYQRGYGFGNIFKKLYKWIVPIFEQKAVPVLKTVGKTLIKGTSNFAEDAINGKNIKDSAKRRFEESLDELSDKAGIMKGDGYSKHINKHKTREANRIRKKRKNNKRTIDIFDKK
jgi:hypothetical protein